MSKSLAIKLSERELITVNENDQLLEAIKKLAKYNIGAIPVINSNKKLTGIAPILYFTNLLIASSN